MRRVLLVFAVSGCAFNDPCLMQEELDQLQYKYAELDSRLDEQAAMMGGLREMCIVSREDIRELQKELPWQKAVTRKGKK